MSQKLTVAECYEIFATSFSQFRFRPEIEEPFLRNLRIELGLEESRTQSSTEQSEEQSDSPSS